MATGGSPVEVLKPSAEKTNYIRLARLIMSGGTTIVRGVFDSIILPPNLPTKLNEPAVFTRLHQMKKDKILFSSQWKVLFPSSSTCGTSESFDITLLFKLLREFCGLPAPPKGWDDLPDDKDISLSDDLARIKYYRNELCHVKDLGISNGDFNSYGKRIKDAFLRMVQTLPSLGPSKYWEEEIDKLLTGPVTEDDEKNVKELESWYLHDMEIKDMLSKIIQQLGSMQPPSKEKSNCGDHLIKYLKEYYRTGDWSLILPFPWMEGDRFHVDNLYTSLTINEKGHTDNIEVENLFSPKEGDNDTAVRRILIEGEAGIGKSTYCKKIAYDWSKGKLQKPDVDLVLVIKCRDLHDGDLWQAIKEQNLPEDLQAPEKAEEVFDYIRVNQHRILLIVDGFDEIPATTETTMTQSIKKLVTGQLLSNSRVILTSRQERCSNVRRYFHKKLQMTGFSWQDSCHFIKHFSSSAHNAAETISSIEQNAAIKELTRCPLNAAFLCLVLKEKKIDGDFLQSLDIGSLYREMVFCVIKRYCVEKKEQEVQDDTLMEEYHEIMVVLGKIAFELMKDNLTTFGEEKLPCNSKQILKDIGFLIEHKILNTIRPKSTYIFSHSSIKEYFAALYVAECLKRGNVDVLTSIHKFTESPSSTDIGNSNHVQNVYYSLQRFDMVVMASLQSSEDYIKLINGLAAHLPNDIDVIQAELFRFDFTFSFICDLLGNCQGDLAIEIIKEIAIPHLPIVLYLYNGKQALNGFVSLLSLSKEEYPKVEITSIRLEGLQASSSIPVEDFAKFSKALGEHRFLKTVYLSFISNSTDFSLFFDHFQSRSVESLRLQYIPQDRSKDSNIFTILRNLPNLSSLDLSNSSIPDVEQFLVPEGVPSITHGALRVLKMRHCILPSQETSSGFKLAFSFKTTSLKELDLCGNDFSDGISLDVKGSSLQILKLSNSNIKELDLSCNNFRYGITLDLEGCSLQVLKMSNCNLKPRDFNSVLHSLSRSDTLKELDFSGNDFSDGISIDLEGCSLQVLKMSNCNLKRCDVNSVLHSLSKSDTLKELDLSGNDFSDGISLDLKGYSLQILKMSNCNLKPRDADFILNSLLVSAALKEADLSGNDFNDGISFDFKGYSLQVLKISNCNLKPRDVTSFLHSLSRSDTLKELDLSGNDFSDCTSLDLEGCALQVLLMSNCNLKPRDADFILHCLSRSDTLKELDLSGNDFSGGIPLDLMGYSLQALKMSNCNLNPSDVTSFLRSLSMSDTLKELDLSGNDLSDGIVDLEGYSLRVLKMSSCNLKPRDVDFILHCLSRSDTLKELDLSGNDLNANFKYFLNNLFSRAGFQF